MTRRNNRKGMEPNLYLVKGYYRYKHPKNKTWHGMGTDKKAANAAARQLNARLMEGRDLVASVLGQTQNTFAALIKAYRRDFLPTKKLKKETLYNLELRLKRIEADLGDKMVQDHDVALAAKYLDDNFKNDSYIKHRTTLIELFAFALTKGWYKGENPFEKTFARTNVKKTRQRLDVDGYKAVYEYEHTPQWLRNAMDFSLITLQGRLEIVSAKFKHIEDERIKVVRSKTDSNEWAFISIGISNELSEVFGRCRQSGILSPFIIHREPVRRNKSESHEHWSQVLPDLLSKEFAKHRDACGHFDHLEKRQRPTFHEIRSLGSWLYKKQGYDNATYVQPLMTHYDEKMTEQYQKGHEIEWREVSADLPLTAILGDK